MNIHESEKLKCLINYLNTQSESNNEYEKNLTDYSKLFNIWLGDVKSFINKDCFKANKKYIFFPDNLKSIKKNQKMLLHEIKSDEEEKLMIEFKKIKEELMDSLPSKRKLDINQEESIPYDFNCYNENTSLNMNHTQITLENKDENEKTERKEKHFIENPSNTNVINNSNINNHIIEEQYSVEEESFKKSIKISFNNQVEDSKKKKTLTNKERLSNLTPVFNKVNPNEESPSLLVSEIKEWVPNRNYSENIDYKINLSKTQIINSIVNEGNNGTSNISNSKAISSKKKDVINIATNDKLDKKIINNDETNYDYNELFHKSSTYDIITKDETQLKSEKKQQNSNEIQKPNNHISSITENDIIENISIFQDKSIINKKEFEISPLVKENIVSVNLLTQENLIKSNKDLNLLSKDKKEQSMKTEYEKQPKQNQIITNDNFKFNNKYTFFEKGYCLSSESEYSSDEEDKFDSSKNTTLKKPKYFQKPEWAINKILAESILKNQINNNLIDKVFKRDKIENLDLALIFTGHKTNGKRNESAYWEEDSFIKTKSPLVTKLF